MDGMNAESMNKIKRCLKNKLGLEDMAQDLHDEAALLERTEIGDEAAQKPKSSKRESDEQKPYKALPELSGVYIFKDKDNLILYIGKAKNLRKRVATYFQKQHKDWKVNALINEYAKLEHIVTHGEHEALLLEAQTIRDHKPKYNVLLTSGQPFVYLHFTKDPLPELEIVRNKKSKGVYFGPFLHKRQARSAHDYLVKTFRLSRCAGKVSGGCLQYHLGNCAGNCAPDFDAEGYRFRAQLAQDLLSGHFAKSLKDLERKIAQYSQELAFEKARNLNQYRTNLETIFQTLKARFSEKKYEREVTWATMPEELKENDYEDTAQELKDLLGLKTLPMTIDCFDISHFQSSYLVGSCIRFTNGKPDKNKFRRFKITSLVTQDDYAALAEVVSRRYRDAEEIPDLVVIDGGKGQLSAALSVLKGAQIVSLAKREERVFTPYNSEGVVLDMQTAAGRLLIALRDYAHHFALSYHQLLRHKNSQY